MRKSLAILLLSALVALVLLPRLPLDGGYLVHRGILEHVLPGLIEQMAVEHVTATSQLILTPQDGTDPALAEDIELALMAALENKADAPALYLAMSWAVEGGRLHADARYRLGERGAGQGRSTFRYQTEHGLPGWTALLPPLLAIVMAFAFRRTLLCLFTGIWLGATLLLGGNPLRGFVWVFHQGVYEHALRDQFRLEILLFVFGLVGAIGIMSRMGGIAGMLGLVERAVTGVRSTQMFAALMGLAIFFDDYANTILVGTTMRPLTDRWRVSRERLAYIVDSTAAPVAGISVLSTWVAYEMSLYADQLPAAGISQDAYIIFMRTIPFRFYSIFTLVLVLFGAATGRSFGPMLKAERRARAGQVSPAEGGKKGMAQRLSENALRRTQMKEGIPARWANAALPLLLVVGLTIALMLSFGNVDGRSLAGLMDLEYLRDTVLSNTNSARALAIAAVSGFALALLLAVGQRLLSVGEALRAGVGNFRAMGEAIGILILAWVMGHVCDLMGTSHTLIAMSSGSLESMALLFPLILFLTSAAVSFATGSSWSTMAILLPNVVLLSSRLGAGTPLGSEGLLLLSIGAVLEGSIFGDHCSPISDTTILSSVASACPHMAHVKTQVPLALTALAVSIAVGYLPVAFGVPVWISLSFGTLILFLIIRFIGKVPEAPGAVL